VTTQVYATLMQRLPESRLLDQGIKFALCLPVLLPPCILMGGTLPAAVKSLVRSVGITRACAWPGRGDEGAAYRGMHAVDGNFQINL
jgi:hypothetical protein